MKEQNSLAITALRTSLKMKKISHKCNIMRCVSVEVKPKFNLTTRNLNRIKYPFNHINNNLCSVKVFLYVLTKYTLLACCTIREMWSSKTAARKIKFPIWEYWHRTVELDVRRCNSGGGLQFCVATCAIPVCKWQKSRSIRCLKGTPPDDDDHIRFLIENLQPTDFCVLAPPSRK